MKYTRIKSLLITINYSLKKSPPKIAFEEKGTWEEGKVFRFESQNFREDLQGNLSLVWFKYGKYP